MPTRYQTHSDLATAFRAIKANRNKLPSSVSSASACWLMHLPPSHSLCNTSRHVTRCMQRSHTTNSSRHLFAVFDAFSIELDRWSVGSNSEGLPPWWRRGKIHRRRRMLWNLITHCYNLATGGKFAWRECAAGGRQPQQTGIHRVKYMQWRRVSEAWRQRQMTSLLLCARPMTIQHMVTSYTTNMRNAISVADIRSSLCSCVNRRRLHLTTHSWSSCCAAMQLPVCLLPSLSTLSPLGNNWNTHGIFSFQFKFVRKSILHSNLSLSKYENSIY